MGNPYWPLFDLRVRSGGLELRYPDDDLVVSVARLAAAGIHDPATMPFSVPWTDAASPELERSTLQYYWRVRAELTPQRWDLPLAVLRGGVVVGVQGVHTTDFVTRRTFHTGSWVGRGFQRQGIGWRMRALALHLGFAGLSAERAESAAFHDNPASIRVSRALGYEDNGDEIGRRRDAADRLVRFVLTRARWEERCRAGLLTDDVTIERLEPCLELLGLSGAGSLP